MRSCVNVSQKTNMVIMKIDEEANFDLIEKSIKHKAAQLKKLYKDAKNPIMITGKVLKNKEMDIIERIITRELEVEVDFDMPKELGLHNIRKTFEREVLTSETKYHRGSLRSGQKIEEDGSIVIIGDVNAGAQVIASENIIVLGALRGLAHAGAKGNRDAIIAAGRLDNTQVRIANIVREFDRDEEPLRKCAYVYADGNEIIIE